MTTAEWVKENISEDEAALREIADYSMATSHRCISTAPSNQETVLTIYGLTFETICEFLRGKESSHKSFNLNVANTFDIGYDTTEDEDDEKQGNFMPYIKHLENPGVDVVLDEEEYRSVELCSIWNARNIKQNPEALKEIAIETRKKLENLINIKLGGYDFVMPLFCITHAQIVRWLRDRRREQNTSDIEINVAGYFVAGCQVTDEGEEEIYFVPGIATKLALKNDSIASATE